MATPEVDQDVGEHDLVARHQEPGKAEALAREVGPGVGAQVGVDQDDAVAERRAVPGQVAGDEGLALAGARARDRHRGDAGGHQGHAAGETLQVLLAALRIDARDRGEGRQPETRPDDAGRGDPQLQRTEDECDRGSEHEAAEEAEEGVGRDAGGALDGHVGLGDEAHEVRVVGVGGALVEARGQRVALGLEGGELALEAGHLARGEGPRRRELRLDARDLTRDLLQPGAQRVERRVEGLGETGPGVLHEEPRRRLRRGDRGLLVGAGRRDGDQGPPTRLLAVTSTLSGMSACSNIRCW